MPSNKPLSDVISDDYIEHSFEQLKRRQELADLVDRRVTALHRKLARLVLEEDPTSNRLAQQRVMKKSKALIDHTYREVAALAHQAARAEVDRESAHTKKAIEDALTNA